MRVSLVMTMAVVVGGAIWGLHRTTYNILLCKIIGKWHQRSTRLSTRWISYWKPMDQLAGISSPLELGTVCIVPPFRSSSSPNHCLALRSIFYLVSSIIEPKMDVMGRPPFRRAALCPEIRGVGQLRWEKYGWVRGKRYFWSR